MPMPTRERKPQAPRKRLVSPAPFAPSAKGAGLTTALEGTT